MHVVCLSLVLYLQMLEPYAHRHNTWKLNRRAFFVIMVFLLFSYLLPKQETMAASTDICIYKYVFSRGPNVARFRF